MGQATQALPRVAILISGGGSNMVALVKAMQTDMFAHPVLVAANDPTAPGLIRAAEMGITTCALDHRPFGKDRGAYERALIAKIAPTRPDIICLAGFMRILTSEFISPFQGKILNIHPSLLPKYPGLNTHERALSAKDSAAGCTVHEVIPELDSGPILGQASVRILPGDNPKKLAARVLLAEHQLYPKVLRRFTLGERAPIYM